MIHLVRHGEAASEASGLSANGRAQVSALASRWSSLSRPPVALVRHGPAQRATETGELLASALDVADVAVTDLLADRTAVPSPARRHEYPAQHHAWLDAVPADERDVDGSAMSAAWRELWAAYASSEVILVTHSFVVAWFVREVLSAPAASWMRLTVANATLTSIDRDRDGDAVVSMFNSP